MKTDDDLKEISGEIAEKVKMFVRGQSMLRTLTEYKALNEEVEILYIDLRTPYNLNDDERKKVDKYFARNMIIGAKKNLRKKKGRKEIQENVMEENVMEENVMGENVNGEN